MTHRRLLVVVLFAVIFSFDLARSTDVDFWWHLRTGELIAQSGAVPRTDPFSYTAQGRPWVVHEWLWELAVYFVYRYGSYAAAVLISATIITLTYALLYRLLRQLGANEMVSAVLVLWAAALALPNLGVRPREFTFLFMVVYLSQLLRYREGRGAHVWVLPPVMLLWVNLHGGFVLGLGLLALFVIDGTVNWLRSRGPATDESLEGDSEAQHKSPLLTRGLSIFSARAVVAPFRVRSFSRAIGGAPMARRRLKPATTENRHSLGKEEDRISNGSFGGSVESPSKGQFPRHLLLVGLATLAAASVNPGGPARLLYPFTYYSQRGNPSFRIVTEFQSPNFHEPLMLLFAGGIVALMALGIRRGELVDGLLAVVFTVQALVSARQVSPCALVLAPLLALVLCERFHWARERPPPRLPRVLLTVNWLLLVMLVVAAVVFAARPRVAAKLQLRAEPLPGDMPLAGARFIEEQNLPAPVFNHQAWGGYLIYRWYPGRRVFIDGRIDMYGPAIVGDYITIANLQPGWSDALEKYGVRTLLIPKDSPLSFLLLEDHRWQRVFQGNIEDVFVKKADKPALAPGAMGTGAKVE
jgi:hypothetical protein